MVQVVEYKAAAQVPADPGAQQVCPVVQLCSWRSILPVALVRTAPRHQPGRQGAPGALWTCRCCCSGRAQRTIEAQRSNISKRMRRVKTVLRSRSGTQKGRQDCCTVLQSDLQSRDESAVRLGIEPTTGRGKVHDRNDRHPPSYDQLV